MLYRIPYGRHRLTFELPAYYRVQEYLPSQERLRAAACADDDIRQAIRAFCARSMPKAQPKSVAIAINDGSRPPIQNRILPILLSELERYIAAIGAAPSAQTGVEYLVCVANGLHTPQPTAHIDALVPSSLSHRCRVVNHDALDRNSLVFLGTSNAGSPIWVNRAFYTAEWKMSISAVTGHQFTGVTGGAKSVAIGLAGADTITHNHSLYRQPYAQLGELERNPVRCDIEDIGREMGLSLTINCALDLRDEIAAVQLIDMQHPDARATFNAFAASVVRECQIDSAGEYDGVIVAGGGYPRDCNLYQLQKALAHVRPLAKAHAPIILCGACDGGVGNRRFEEHFASFDSAEEVLAPQRSERFQIGRHKSTLFARDMQGRRVALVSELEPMATRRLHFTPIPLTCDDVERFFAFQNDGRTRYRVALIPYPVHCYFRIGSREIS